MTRFMKKLLSFWGLIFLAGYAAAQQLPDLRMPPAGFHPNAPASLPAPPPVQTQSVNSFFIDYDAADAAIYGSRYQRLVWPMNDHYTASDSALRYCIVAFDSLYDLASDTGYAADSIGNLAIDSIFLMIGQENNSGLDDTLSVKIIALDSVHGYPQPSVIYWSTSLVIPASAPLSGDWRTIVSLKMIPYLSLYKNRFGIMVEYFGPVSDSLGIVSGFGFRDTCGSLNRPADTTHFSSVRKQSASSFFRANSFALWSQYQFIGTLPTQNGSNIYYDCNNNGQYDGGQDGESFIQNVQFIAHVKTNAAGVQEWGRSPLSLRPNRPNPFSSVTSICYSLVKDAHIRLNVTDLAGRLVWQSDEGNKGSGDHAIAFTGSGLQSGTYIYTVYADGMPLSGKMTLIK
jgi:hypothetical protein